MRRRNHITFNEVWSRLQKRPPCKILLLKYWIHIRRVLLHVNKRVEFKTFRHSSYYINKKPQQFQPLKVSIKMKQAVLRHNFIPLQRY